jgi:hypothetical protein
LLPFTVVPVFTEIWLMLSSGVTSLSNTLSFAFDFDENLEVFESLLSPLLDLALLAILSPAHVPALEGGRGYSSGSLRTVDALEGGARLLEAAEGGGWLETRWTTSSVVRITVLALWLLLTSEWCD